MASERKKRVSGTIRKRKCRGKDCVHLVSTPSVDAVTRVWVSASRGAKQKKQPSIRPPRTCQHGTKSPGSTRKSSGFSSASSGLLRSGKSDTPLTNATSLIARNNSIYSGFSSAVSRLFASIKSQSWVLSSDEGSICLASSTSCSFVIFCKASIIRSAEPTSVSASLSRLDLQRGGDRLARKEKREKKNMGKWGGRGIQTFVEIIRS
ncbi:hypothetical protein F5883DRAFT_41013 [Diaporthe sp. PMI_573]|nr:hypothetical protein F5883DRAFT_41013 [Diaporthaceae sp. PMI_573]